MKINESQQIKFEVDGLTINGKNYITLSKEKWKIEQTDDLIILSPIEF